MRVMPRRPDFSFLSHLKTSLVLSPLTSLFFIKGKVTPKARLYEELHGGLSDMRHTVIELAEGRDIVICSWFLTTELGGASAGGLKAEGNIPGCKGNRGLQSPSPCTCCTTLEGLM
jgi:hypothetical protein